MTSSLSPECENIMTLSFLVIAPTSPCIASAALIKKAGDPVLERVADVLLAICPDFPTPRQIILPLEFKRYSHKAEKSLLRDSESFFRASDSKLRVLLADFR